jgi:hypothetical protein
MQASTLTCTQCGGENTLPSGRRILSCEFCDATLFFDRSGTVSYYQVPRLLGEQEARAALLRWMAGNDTVKGLDRESSVEGLRAIAFPVWLFRVRGAHGEEALIEPAAPTPIPQLADLELPAGRLEPYRPEDGAVESVAAVIPLETARGWVDQRGGGEPSETALVQVPLWHCRYSFAGHHYQALVDASTGSVMSAVYPEKAESPFYLVAGLGLVLFGLEGLLISNLFYKLMAYAVTAVPLTLLAYWVARKV